MLSKARISLIKSLEFKKYRQINGLFVAEGTKIVTEIINSEFEITVLYATTNWLSQNDSELSNRAFNIHEVNQKEIDKLSFLTSPQEAIALIKIPDQKISDYELFNNPVIFLDDIRDPGNLGTIIRTADWFGINHVVCSLNSVDVYNPKTVQATMGSISRVKVFYIDLPEILRNSEEKTSTYAATMDGENLFAADTLKNPWIFIGNESKGISDELLGKIKTKIAIPRFGTKVESLNASVATAIILSEFKRQGAF